MIIHFHKKFMKDMDRLPTFYKSRIEKFVFETLPGINYVQNIPGAEKLKGYNEYYKVRFGDYRVGFRIEAETIVLERVLHRKEIYRYFPID